MEDWKYKPARDLNMRPIERMGSLRREIGLVSLILQSCWWALVRCYLTCWHRLSVRGRANLPATTPFVMVANHRSHLDALCLAAALSPRQRAVAFPIAAGDTFFTSQARTAFAALCLNALPMWRRKCGSHALQELRERLTEDDCTYIIFPEGTRSRSGALERFKPGVGMLVAETNIPVVPCYLRGAHIAWPPNHRCPRPRKVSLTIGIPRTFEDISNERSGWNDIAGQLQEAVTSLAEQTDDAPA